MAWAPERFTAGELLHGGALMALADDQRIRNVIGADHGSSIGADA